MWVCVASLPSLSVCGSGCSPECPGIGESSSQDVWQGSAQVQAVCASFPFFFSTWRCSRIKEKCHFLAKTQPGMYLSCANPRCPHYHAALKQDGKADVSGHHLKPKGAGESLSKAACWSKVLWTPRLFRSPNRDIGMINKGLEQHQDKFQMLSGVF